MMLCFISVYATIGFFFGIFLFFWDKDSYAVKHLIGDIIGSVFVWPYLMFVLMGIGFQEFMDWLFKTCETNDTLNKRLKKNVTGSKFASKEKE